MADQLLKELGITEGVTLQLNTLGDADTRDAWRAALVAHFEARRGELSEESLVRLEKNPMRILDSKDPRDRPIADTAPGIDEFMTSAAQDFFAAVTAGLDAAEVAWTRNARLVRGLDYYLHTAFEFVTDRLGAQGTVLGGGRYDGLMESLGGPPTPAVGWAAGIERLAMLIAEPTPQRSKFILSSRQVGAELGVLKVTSRLRKVGVSAESELFGPPRRRYDKAQSKAPEFVLMLIPYDSGSETDFIVQVNRGEGSGSISREAANVIVADALSQIAKVELVESVPPGDPDLRISLNS
jgi:histidyl-tRNA synthetase